MLISRQRERLFRVILAFSCIGTALFLGSVPGGIVLGAIAALLLHRPRENRIPVLAYHSIHLDQDWMGAPDLVVSPALFRRQMSWLDRSGFSAVSMDELFAARRDARSGKLVAIHFDDGYLDTLTNATPILRQHSLKGTVFISPGILADNIAPDSPLALMKSRFLSRETLSKISRSGIVEVQSHAWSHTPLTQLSPAARVQEFTDSRMFLEDLTERTVRHLCFPRDDFSEEIIEEALSCGFISYTGGKGYNTPHTPEQVSRVYITSSGHPKLDMLRFIAEVRVFQGWYWLYPFLWLMQRYTRLSWRKYSNPRLTP